MVITIHAEVKQALHTVRVLARAAEARNEVREAVRLRNLAQAVTCAWNQMPLDLRHGIAGEALVQFVDKMLLN